VGGVLCSTIVLWLRLLLRLRLARNNDRSVLEPMFQILEAIRSGLWLMMSTLNHSPLPFLELCDPTSRMTRAASATLSDAVMFWIALRACSMRSASLQGSVRSQYGCNPWPLSTISVGGHSACSSRARAISRDSSWFASSTSLNSEIK